MIAHRNKKIKEQLPTPLHLILHRPAPLKRVPAPDDQSQIMRPELRITVRRIGIRISCRRQDRRTLYPALQALLPQRQPLQLVQAVFLRGAVHQCILQQLLSGGLGIHCALHRASCCSTAVRRGVVFGLKLPAVFALVVEQPRVVVAFVEVFEHRGENLGGLVRQGDAFGDAFEELGAADCGEEGGEGEDVFVGGEEALFRADAEGYDWGGHCAVGSKELAVCRHTRKDVVM